MLNRTRPAESASQWAAFEAEALPYLAEMFRVAMWFVRNRTEAEDLVQETFTQALQSFHRFEPGTNCRAWLVTIMYRALRRKRQAETRLRLVGDNERLLAETPAFELPTPERLTDEVVLSALRRLPLQFQEVVVLADIEEMAYKEIAEALGVPIGTVMSRLYRGRRTLRAELAGYANERGLAQSTAASAGATE